MTDPGDTALSARVERATGRRVVRNAALGGGCVTAVRRLHLDGGASLVAKLGGAGQPDLRIEAFMLRCLAERSALPVPAVVFAEETLLLLTWIDSDGLLDAHAEADAAGHLAALHDVRGEAFGFDRDTLIGPLPQVNPWSPTWRDFFRDHRLRAMAEAVHAAGRLPAATRARIETLAGRLDRWIDEPEAPSLIHGDMWTGNVLCHGGRIAGFVDPAVYYADAEIELAFSTLFGTFGRTFFAAYGERRPIRPGFFEVRRDLYNLYPLLVHVRLFGGSYLGGIHRTLDRLGV